MNKIKFRLRDKDKKIIGYEWFEQGEDLKGHWHYDFSMNGIEEYFKQFTWMNQIRYRDMFTSVLDKNGKDIYENDIVKYSDIYSDEYMIGANQVIGVIKWVDNRCSLNPQQAEENTRGGHYVTLWSNIMEIEIIGDIYNNSKFLEEKNQ